MPAPLGLPKKQQQPRSETVPPSGDRAGTASMTSAAEVAKILNERPDDVLLLDLRVYPQYAASRIRTALNLCIPTTLLKRPAFTVEKLAETFTSDHDKAEFAKWQDCAYIIVYDSSSTQAKEAVMPFNVLKKFEVSGWSGQGLVVKGGFVSFSKTVPQMMDNGATTHGKGSSTQPLSISAPNRAMLPVAGGCSMPTTEQAANPFFGNIRQNMDLLDGVGQMPIKKPVDMSERDKEALPRWLLDAASSKDEGKNVSDKFLGIERSEQKRMQQALSGEVSYGTPMKERSGHVKVAGIEKGSKNRYNNIFPYDHTRVKLQDVPTGGCDYVNANYVKAAYSNRRYIATQAPIPATFEDFWRVVWEQDVKVIVMLTAESEGGQLKSHPYWNSGDYGNFKVKKLNERQVPLDKYRKTDMAAPVRPSLGTRRSTQPHTIGEKKVAEERKTPASAEAPVVTLRNLALSHSSQPFQQFRDITQLHYTQWPDFGAPASPTAILGLIEYVNKYVRTSSNSSKQQPPVIVHCSAGCGRTGTFCTVDSVIDMLKQQKNGARAADEDAMDVDVPDNWLSRDDIDLVAKTVHDFRHQRLSMVQNLRQFVLCYESILQWIVAEEHKEDRSRSDGRGRSFQGSLDLGHGLPGRTKHA